MCNFRIGHGYDVHRLVEGRDLILGGLKIEYDRGCLGHSDADVLLHAIMDALLGAVALGDIGRHFPDNDPAYKGADSGKLLTKVVELLENNGAKVVNIDATLILQRPKVAPFIADMRANIASIVGLPIDCVNVKATTEEGLGFTGNGDGVSAHAVALVELCK